MDRRHRYPQNQSRRPGPRHQRRGLLSDFRATSIRPIPTFPSIPSSSAPLRSIRAPSPVNNPFISGTGVAATTNFGLRIQHRTPITSAYQQYFTSGTSFNVAWDNTRSSNGSTAKLFQSLRAVLAYRRLHQQLLNGFGYLRRPPQHHDRQEQS